MIRFAPFRRFSSTNAWTSYTPSSRPPNSFARSERIGVMFPPAFVFFLSVVLVAEWRRHRLLLLISTRLEFCVLRPLSLSVVVFSVGRPENLILVWLCATSTFRPMHSSRVPPSPSETLCATTLPVHARFELTLTPLRAPDRIAAGYFHDGFFFQSLSTPKSSDKPLSLSPLK